MTDIPIFDHGRATCCECGALADESIYNGKYHIPVCHACWILPENIMTEVTCEIAGDALALKLPFNMAFSELDAELQDGGKYRLMSAMTVRELNYQVLREDMERMLELCWDEWYGPKAW